MLTTDVFNENAANNSRLLLRGNLPSDIYIYTLKSDYVFPFKKGKVETGVKSSYVKNVTVAEYARLVTDKWMDDDRSNEFVFEENINAAYVNLQQQLKKWTFQAGLRYENTNAKGMQVTSGTSFTRHLHSLFPSAFTSYALDKNNSLTVSYSRRINRPNYKDLNPFIYFLDSLTYAIGNPNLKPQYTHRAEVSHAFKSKFITTFSYSNTTDVIAQILRQKPDERITYVSRENVARFRNIALSVTAPLKITKWWNANFYGNVYNNRYQGIYENTAIDAAYTSFMLNITNSLKLGRGYSAEVSGFYQHKGFNQLTYMMPMYQMSAGVQKKVLGEKGTLRVNVRDPFAWQRFSGITRYGDLYFHERNRPDTRQVSMSFSYRFGKNAQPGQTPSRRNSSSQEEQNRVGN
jgi:outer membrane receptor protein involved in Fe transport